MQAQGSLNVKEVEESIWGRCDYRRKAQRDSSLLPFGDGGRVMSQGIWTGQISQTLEFGKGKEMDSSLKPSRRKASLRTWHWSWEYGTRVVWNDTRKLILKDLREKLPGRGYGANDLWWWRAGGSRNKEKVGVQTCYSKCGPWTSSINITWKVVRNANALLPY